MSPASKSKSKDKRAAVKDPQKSSAKPSSNANTGVPASGYNPLLGTFHTLDTAPPIQLNGRSRNFDDTEDHSGNSVGIGVEYDSVSNNGSWSGESEDLKDKTSQASSRQETIPNTVDNDKREKIRQKNEKKHQRQKERRAQELHERCSGYLMSRKLEALAQQLVAMGFSSERATMALILNEGRVEQSVAWLFDGGEDADNHREPNLDSGSNLKIDISEELAQITEMEIKFKCSKQEVERAIVACEGDLGQAAETLKVQKHEQPPAAPPKLEEICGSLTSVTTSQNSLASRTQSKAIPIQQNSDDSDFNYTKSGVVTVGPSSAVTKIKSLQLLKKIPLNSDWTKQQQAAAANSSVEKRWPVSAGGSNPSVSYSLTSPLQAAPPSAKTESRCASIGTELKNLQLGLVRDPVIVMQRPKPKNVHTSVGSFPSASVVDWHPNAVDPVINHNGFSHGPTSTRSFNTPGYGNNLNMNHNGFSHDQFHYQQQQQQPLSQQQYASSSGPLDHHFSQQGSMNHFNNSGTWNRMMGTNTSPTLAAASSLGLFSGLGSNGSSGPPSHVDWNACDLLQFDYTNIDWSLDRLPHPSISTPRPNGTWMGSNPAELYAQRRVGGGGGGNTAMRSPTGILSNGNHVPSMGLHPDVVGAVGSEASAGGSREWSSPFEEKELFSFPRQFVSSPSL